MIALVVSILVAFVCAVLFMRVCFPLAAWLSDHIRADFGTLLKWVIVFVIVAESVRGVIMAQGIR